MKDKPNVRRIIRMMLLAGFLLTVLPILGTGPALAAEQSSSDGMSMDMSGQSQPAPAASGDGMDMPGMTSQAPDDQGLTSADHQAADAISWPVLVTFAAVNGITMLTAGFIKLKKRSAKEVTN